MEQVLSYYLRHSGVRLDGELLALVVICFYSLAPNVQTLPCLVICFHSLPTTRLFKASSNGLKQEELLPIQELNNVAFLCVLEGRKKRIFCDLIVDCVLGHDGV